MSKFHIIGGNKLNGEITVSGNKNSVFPLFSASIIGSSASTFLNCPQIKDAKIMLEIMEKLGIKVSINGDQVQIDPKNINSCEIDAELGAKLRGGIVLGAALLLKFGNVYLPRPGGDPIGSRPLVTHFEALNGFGATHETDSKGTTIKAEKLLPANIFLEEASVTATEMAIIVASGLDGESIIEGAAAEPHIVDLAEFLNKMGAKIEGAGTNLVKVTGNLNLVGAEFSLRPDFIEAGTFAIAAAITGGEIIIHDAWETDLKMICIFLKKMGVKLEFTNSTTLKVYPSILKATQKIFKTRTWPGFPTDMMSQFIVLATQTEGTVLCHDWMYETRMYFVDRLIKMGAEITIADPHRVIIVGPNRLHGDLIPTADIRAGGALVLAGLAATGETIVEHAEVIDRGYVNFEEKLKSLGANISRTE